jgi:ribosome biogenesis GTPase / thiamine phosphate phosphatase
MAQVIAAYGRQFLLSASSGEQPLKAVARGRRGDCVVGDRVAYRRLNNDQAVIDEVLPRDNQVTRSDNFRSKTIAANVDLAGIVISGYPRFDEALLVRILIALEAEGIAALLVVTKQDLDLSREAMAGREAVYRSLGYPVINTAAKSAPESLGPLVERLRGKRTLLLGQSGMGKSTLVNALVRGAEQQTAAISAALASGRHTTTFTRAFELEEGGWILDSPGFQTFEIAHLSRWQLVHAMPEFRPLLGKCRFNDCSHRDEPGCAIRSAVREGRIDPLRYKLFAGIESA